MFAFDPASNRVPVNNGDAKEKAKTIHKSGRPTEIKTHDKFITFTYDSHGRALFKTQTRLGKNGQALKQLGSAIAGFRTSLQLAYNADHELTRSISITQEGLALTEVNTTYQYDAFGRRIAKHSQSKDKTKRVSKNLIKFADRHIQQQKTQHKHISYLWNGNRQLQKQTVTHVFTTIYEQDSFAPMARMV